MSIISTITAHTPAAASVQNMDGPPLIRPNTDTAQQEQEHGEDRQKPVVEQPIRQQVTEEASGQKEQSALWFESPK